MPYITEEARRELGDRGPKTAGELNYCLSLVIKQYIRENGLNYQNCNDVVGALDGAKVEFQRRVVAPYEDKKIRENGDIYHSSMTGA